MTCIVAISTSQSRWFPTKKNTASYMGTPENCSTSWKKLSKEQMNLVNQFHSHVINVLCMEVEAQFQYGFSLGLMLMKEVYELLENGDGND